MSETENLVERRVTYTLEINGKLYVVKNVPTRVDDETGEQFFAPRTVDRLRETILGGERPDRVVETPVYEYPGKTSNQSPRYGSRRTGALSG